VIHGYDERRATVRYVPTLCPDKTVDIGEKRIAVSLSYIKYESLLEHADHIHRSQTKEAGSAITTAGHHGPLSGAPKHRYLHVESEWFENDVAVCLQALQDEFEGYDLCSGGQNIHRTKEDLARAKSPLPYSENIRSDIAPLPEQ
jgi:hypothetical protein